MATDWGLWPSAISSASALGGVLIGAGLTQWRESKRENDRRVRESNYLSILLLAHLDRFADGCLSVAYDDGTSEGQPAGGNGFHATTVALPQFDPLSLDVDWKVLPRDLMHKILYLPHRVEQLSSTISNKYEYDDAPEYACFFWARRHGFAVLGLEASDIARRLRNHSGVLEMPPIEEDQNRDESLRSIRDTITAERDAHNARLAASNRELFEGLQATKTSNKDKTTCPT